ncbi:MAG TPA: hypothetical protein EYQ50_09545 [Verrucomicrobiales bacterium]|nr:hypothetical protein [Verrucomicrobiales bacterium]
MIVSGAYLSYDTAAFEKAWPITSGVLQTTGVMKFVSPGPGFVPGKYEDNEHILVFPESRNVHLKSPVAIDLAEPGEYRLIKRTEKLYLEAGHRVRTYLLQLNPVGRPDKHDPNKIVVIGQITFGAPILGLIGTDDNLTATDALLGHFNGSYRKSRRGVETPRRETGTKGGRDTVILAADQRTLILHLAAGSAQDQIRVLVAAE